MFALNHLIGFGVGGGDAIFPTQSIDFEASSSQRLQISNTDWGTLNRSKCAWSFWLKPETATSGDFCSKSGTTDYEWRFALSGSKVNVLFLKSGGTSNGSGISTNTLSAGTWAHVMIHFDYANATSSERFKMWINGAAETIASYSAPSAALQTTTEPVNIASRESGGSDFYDGLLYQVAFFSNYLPSISEIYNTVTNKPKDIRTVTGLHSLLDVAGGSVVSDYVLSADWTNTNTATASSDIPA